MPMDPGSLRFRVPRQEWPSPIGGWRNETVANRQHERIRGRRRGVMKRHSMKSTKLTCIAATTFFAAPAKPVLLARALKTLVVLGAVLVASGLARATFPGENGLIVFDTLNR